MIGGDVFSYLLCFFLPLFLMLPILTAACRPFPSVFSGELADFAHSEASLPRSDAPVVTDVEALLARARST